MFRALGRFYGLRTVGTAGRPVPRGVDPGLQPRQPVGSAPDGGHPAAAIPVHTLAKEELFRPSWPLGAVLRWIDGIPIRRKGYDAAAFGEALAALQAGHNLLIFPEGTRRPVGSPGPVKNGLGILIQATRAPMLPIFIRGSYGRQPGGSSLSPLEVSYGPVIRWHALDQPCWSGRIPRR